MTRLENMLIDHEGLKLNPYKDSVGKLTMGVGRNLDDVGITKEEAIYLMRNDIAETNASLSKFSWFKELNNARQDVIIDMVFNMGLPRFLGFKKMIEALRAKNYDEAAKEMLDSDWSKQVGRRSRDLEQMMRTGEHLYEP